MLKEFMKDKLVNKTIEVNKGQFRGNFTINKIKEIELDYSSVSLLDIIGDFDGDNWLYLTLNKVGVKVEFSFEIQVFGTSATIYNGECDISGLTQIVRIQFLEKDGVKTVLPNLGTATIDSLYMIFDYKPYQYLWNTLFFSHFAQQALVNKVAGVINGDIEANPIQYNKNINAAEYLPGIFDTSESLGNFKELVMGLLGGLDIYLKVPDVELIIAGTQKGINEHTMRVIVNTDFMAQKHLNPTKIHELMTVLPQSNESSHLFVSTNILDNLLWGIMNTGQAEALISQTFFDLIGFTMIRAMTKDIKIVFEDILVAYPPDKGVYLKIEAKKFDQTKTRTTMRQGRLNILLQLDAKLYVDTNSKNYPQKSVEECGADCELAGFWTLDLMANIMGGVTANNVFTTTPAYLTIYGIEQHECKFDFDIDFFKKQLETLVNSLLSVPTSFAIDLKATMLAAITPSVDILGDV